MTHHIFIHQFNILYSWHIIILIYINEYQKSTPSYTTNSTLPNTSVGCMSTHNHRLYVLINKLPTTKLAVVI